MSHKVRKNSYLETLYEKYGEDFFKEEVRSDFLVTTERKEIWAVLLDLYEHFVEICNRHNLQYYIVGGFLIGAARHAGFIPWDDDLDVLMPREDYDRLVEYKDEFSYPFFLQTPFTDSGYAGSFTKLRNSETAAVDPTNLRKLEPMNMGIYLDIFPLDRAHKDDAEEMEQKINALTLKCTAYMKHNAVVLTEYDQHQVDIYYDAQIKPTELYQTINEIASSYKNDDKAECLAQFVFTLYDITRELWPASCFEKTVQLPFESITVTAASGFDECLRITYGDYMKFPLVSERGQWHGRLIFRPDTPYLQAINEYLTTLDETE